MIEWIVFGVACWWLGLGVWVWMLMLATAPMELVELDDPTDLAVSA